MEIFVFPFPKWEIVDPEKKISVTERLHINKAIKEKRKHIIRHFTDKESYGEMWRPYFYKLMNALRVGDGYVNILPGFFDLLLHLVNTKREFSIIFRTFGDMHDISMVTKEFNQFCEGKHPWYEKQVPKELKQRALYIDKNYTSHKLGYMFLHGHKPTQVHFITGTIDRPVILEKLINHEEIPDLAQIITQESNVSVNVVTGYERIYDTVLQETQDGSTCSFRDFYYWWNANNEYAHSGKCFVVDPSDENTLQIFLDDNIYMSNDFPAKSIVNLRDKRTGELMRNDQYMDLFLVQVEPLDAIPNRNYFIEKVELCERNWSEFLQMK